MGGSERRRTLVVVGPAGIEGSFLSRGHVVGFVRRVIWFPRVFVRSGRRIEWRREHVRWEGNAVGAQ